MIDKDRLLNGLNELINVEEGMVTLLTNFSKALLKETYGIEEDKKSKINKRLSHLYRDSARHNEMIHNMVEEITKSNINEY